MYVVTPILYDIVLQYTSKFSVRTSTVRNKYILFILLGKGGTCRKWTRLE